MVRPPPLKTVYDSTVRNKGGGGGLKTTALAQLEATMLIEDARSWRDLILGMEAWLQGFAFYLSFYNLMRLEENTGVDNY